MAASRQDTIAYLQAELERAQQEIIELKTQKTRQTWERDIISRSIIDNHPDVIVVLDGEFRIEYMNHVPADKSLDDIIGLDFFDYISPSYREFAQPAFEQAAQSPDEITSFETQGLRRSGGMGSWHSRIFPIRENGVVTHYTQIATDVTEIKQAMEQQNRLQADIIKAQKQAIQELSAPVIPIMEGVIILPLVGHIDSHRAHQIMRSLMQGVGQYRARYAIIDITGVPLVDSGVADHLNRSIQAIRLKGAETIITGISDAVAEVVVDLGIDWSEVKTLRNLQSGLHYVVARRREEQA